MLDLVLSLFLLFLITGAAATEILRHHAAERHGHPYPAGMLSRRLRAFALTVPALGLFPLADRLPGPWALLVLPALLALFAAVRLLLRDLRLLREHDQRERDRLAAEFKPRGRRPRP
jgi:hypothetical protein